jgi:hypothetical protein
MSNFAFWGYHLKWHKPTHYIADITEKCNGVELNFCPKAWTIKA